MFDVYNCHSLFGLLNDHIRNLKMDALTSFIVVVIAITIQFSLYAIKRLQEPLEPNYFIDWEMIEKISLANSHLPQLIGFVLISIGYTLGNKFYLPEIKQK